MKTENPLRRALAVAVLTALALFAASCGQDPIFYVISKETAPRLPMIRGTPTAMAVVNNEMFVAARQGVYKYSGGAWQSIPGPGGGRPMGLAATTGNLFILTMSDSINSMNMTVSRLENNGTWTAISGASGNIQTIFATGNTLYAGTGRGGDDGGIFVVSGTSTSFTNIANGTGMLTGAAGGHLSTKGGILDTSGTWVNKGPLFMGMIKVGSDTIAIESEGSLYKLNGSKFDPIQVTNSDGPVDGQFMTTGREVTGALAIWKDDETNPSNIMLVVGVKGNTGNYGYVEFRLNTTNGSIDTNSSRIEADNLVSVQGANAQYRTSLGRLPVNHLFQAPASVDAKMTFFASTQINGLWSFRVLDGVPQWNAEA